MLFAFCTLDHVPLALVTRLAVYNEYWLRLVPDSIQALLRHLPDATERQVVPFGTGKEPGSIHGHMEQYCAVQARPEGPPDELEETVFSCSRHINFSRGIHLIFARSWLPGGLRPLVGERTKN